jgi:glucose 1-dehydrogenase
MIDLRGHAALVTGSTHGIGRAIALSFAAAGCDVLVHGAETLQDCQKVVEACRAKGVRSEAVVKDFLDGEPAAISERMFSDSVRAFPKLDVLVNNAGHNFDVSYEQMTPALFDRTMRLNVYMPYLLTHRFANHWISKGVNGRVLMMGSINGQLAEENTTAYDTSKGAIGMMVKSLAVTLASKNIRVNGLAPGLIRTQQSKFLDEQPELNRWLTHHTPNRTIPEPEACGPAAVFLCSDAASHVHGAMLMVDGGMSGLQQPGPI